MNEYTQFTSIYIYITYKWEKLNITITQWLCTKVYTGAMIVYDKNIYNL
jgi:hypothetical protein